MLESSRERGNLERSYSSSEKRHAKIVWLIVFYLRNLIKGWKLVNEQCGWNLNWPSTARSADSKSVLTQLYYYFKCLRVWTDLAVRVNDLVVLIILNSFTKSGESGTSTLPRTNKEKQQNNKLERVFFSSNIHKRWTSDLRNSYQA